MPYSSPKSPLMCPIQLPQIHCPFCTHSGLSTHHHSVFEMDMQGTTPSHFAPFSFCVSCFVLCSFSKLYSWPWFKVLQILHYSHGNGDKLEILEKTNCNHTPLNELSGKTDKPLYGNYLLFKKVSKHKRVHMCVLVCKRWWKKKERKEEREGEGEW